MSLFHQHRWLIHSTDYTPAQPGPFKQSGPAEVIERMYRAVTEGVTHIYLRCEGCGAIDEKDVYGHFKAEVARPSDSDLEQLRKIAGLD